VKLAFAQQITKEAKPPRDYIYNETPIKTNSGAMMI
jgi:hypothetical protein